ncbi:hypothetical protein [Atlantibacter hermannii]|uniref:hypothetical protein n=1 Tax=Atlantibacter hermannii TaxID=565 RepID=UPI0028A19E09|nr:hypothetical protein [Atlantibacter hermannii]
MISSKELFQEISNQCVCEGGEVVGYFVKNSRMNLLENLLSAPAVQAEQLSGNTEQVSQPYKLREGLAAIRNLGPIDAEKIQAERDALNEPDVPDGYALVPVELTPDMRAAWDSAPNTDDDDHNMQAAYRAMIAAAPKQEAE